MTSRLLHPDEYELDMRSRSSIDSQGTFNLDEADFESQTVPKHSSLIYRPSLVSRIFGSNYYSGYRRLNPSKPFFTPSKRPSCYRRCVSRRLSLFLQTFFFIILALLLLASIFRPSYTWRPAHYTALSRTVANSTASGRGNPRNEKIFIAASLYDRGGDIAGGQWGERILALIDLLGEDNVFLSIYENDSGSVGAGALLDLDARVSCNKSIVFDDKLDWADLHAVTVPGGSKRVKRIEYLAEVRNRALRPLDTHSELRFDKLLYLNDIIFDPVDALQLLFSTHADENGVAQYRAACAVDFINPFKFYDTYATRDLQGYGVGLPFFPWFTTAGNGLSRKDVLAGTDAVRVRSCWGGMVAFDARYFQQPKAGPSQDHVARFRASHDPFWEASECCLIHADIQDIPVNPEDIEDTGIYMNPFVRVAYDHRSFSWLGFTRRFERLYTLIHNIGSHLASLPHYNPRRTEVPGQRVFETAWVPNEDDYRGGSYQDIRRIAANDGFCGRRGLQVLVEDRVEGQAGWETIPIPT
ncbi:cryptococcal mannosyltransferase 1-domain-containing protein [Aspergillus granulosus]|uniref:Cryptococcal mannosyltransferase 1-domain-containing protein n=1 Tax=Aspergillus granulosus TaxID=176169 RepID=A0ABR4HPV3_9EURO